MINAKILANEHLRKKQPGRWESGRALRFKMYFYTLKTNQI